MVQNIKYKAIDYNDNYSCWIFYFTINVLLCFFMNTFITKYDCMTINLMII